MTSDWAIWCDNCYDFVTEVQLNYDQGRPELSCMCGNILMRKLTVEAQKEKRIELARAIWGL